MDSPKKKTKAYLTQIYGENTSRKYKLMCMKVTIGRSLHSEIRLQNPNISRNHCTLFRIEKGWTITDNKSQNGTYISGKKLKPGETRLLQCGDIIFLGPPSEMPEAFCFDDSFVDDEDIAECGHEIIELPSVKRPAEEVMIASKKKKLGRRNSVVESKETMPLNNEILMKTEPESQSKQVPVSSQKNDKCNTKFEIENPTTIKSITDSEKSCQLNEAHSEIQSPHSVHSSSLKLLNDSDNGYQFNEISSTGDDQSENSLSLLDLQKEEKSLSSSFENGENAGIAKDPKTAKTAKLINRLQSAIANLSERMKIVEKKYKFACEKNFVLDQKLTEVSEQKKILEKKDLEKKEQDIWKHELLETYEEDLICNICTELLIKPAVLNCAHTFCLFCIKEWKKKKNDCPICRNKIQTLTPILTLENFIDKSLAKFTPEQKERRNQIIADRENPPKKVATPTSRRSRHGRRRHRRSLTSVNRHILPQSARENDVQFVDERRSILPMQLTIPHMLYSNFRIPEMLLDNDGDSIRIESVHVPVP